MKEVALSTLIIHRDGYSQVTIGNVTTMNLRRPVGKNYQWYLEDETDFYDIDYVNEKERPEYFNISFFIYKDGKFISRVNHYENFDISHDKFEMFDLVEISIF
jgi:hypothetical protein